MKPSTSQRQTQTRPAAEAPAGIVTGTRVLTLDGEMPVEFLTPGDRVITQGVGNLKQGSAIKPVPASSPQRVGAPAGKSADKSAATKGQ